MLGIYVSTDVETTRASARGSNSRGCRSMSLGGYHLAGEAMETRIGPTVHDLEDRINELGLVKLSEPGR